ncbi:MAG: hypothetical protein R6V44_19065 [Paracoccaceae bacterium]
MFGTILDSSSIVLIPIPRRLTVAQGRGLDLIRFGAVAAIAVGVGPSTPSFGIGVQVMKSTLGAAARGRSSPGAAPFALLALAPACPGLTAALV